MSVRHEISVAPRRIALAPFFVPAPARRFHSPVVWLNLVCLDAPIVALTWQWIFAQTFHVEVAMPTRCALFLTAWIIYLADRFADSRSFGPDSRQSLRQQFCRRHQRMWVVVLLAASCANSWIILRQLETRIFFAGLVVGLLSIIYLTMNYSLGKILRNFPVKELFIGFLFAFGTIAAFLPELGINRSQLVLTGLFFAALCSLNCISIAVWERELDREQGKESLATCWPGLDRQMRIFDAVLTVACGSAALWSATQRAPFFCMAFSAALLGMLDWMRNSIPPNERTALADLVLLTPLLLAVRLG